MFNISGSAINAGNVGIWVSQGNVANSTHPSFARRRVDYASAADGGVRATVRRVVDYDLLGLYWRRMGSLGASEAGQSSLARLEAVFIEEPPMGEAGARQGQRGLGMGWLFDQMIGAGSDPNAATGRQGVLSAARAVAQNFNRIDHGLSEIQAAADKQWRGTVQSINRDSAALADLNGKISAARARGQDAFALLDQRDALIASLHGLTGAQIVHHSDDTIDLVLPGGMALVAGPMASRLTPGTDARGAKQLTLQAGESVLVLRPQDIAGAMKGIADSDRIVAEQRASMRAFAQVFAERFNAQLAEGYDSRGEPGRALFVYDQESGRMTLDPTVGVNELAFSGRPDVRDGDNLRKLQALADGQIEIPGLGQLRLVDVYSAIRGEAASARSNNVAALERDRADADAALAAAEQVSAVSRNEEALTLAELKRFIDANQKALIVSRDLLAGLISAI